MKQEIGIGAEDDAEISVEGSDVTDGFGVIVLQSVGSVVTFDDQGDG